MKKRLAIITIIAASLVMLLSGCDPTLEQGGKKVQFTAKSRGFISTKTSYSAYVTDPKDEKFYQRINWTPGDVIRLYSPKDEGNLWSPNMELQATNVIPENPYLKLVYSDYTLKAQDEEGNATISPDGRYSNAKLFNNGDNGLTWTGNPATFYGAYPVMDEDNNGEDDRLVPHAMDVDGETLQHLLMEIKIPGAGTNGQTGDSAFVSTMPLLAKTGPLTSGSAVKLDFDPYFSAYEFNLNAKEEEITINSITLSATEGFISGHYYWDLTAGVGHPELGTPNTADDKTITVSGSWQIKPATDNSVAKPANITLFGLPNDLKKMTLTINFTVNGRTGNAELYLGDNTVFGARQKTRIKGLALKGGQWQLEIDGEVLPWTRYQETLAQQISLWNGVTITGAIENTELWRTTVGWDDVKNRASSNHYESDGTYSQYYQLRNLNIHNTIAAADRYFEMSFMPTGPTGGYWELVPTFKDGDTESQNHFRFELSDREGAPFKEVGMDGLTGQVLSSKVTIRIYPDRGYDWSNTNLYYMWFKYYCRSSRTSSPISGDSEFQDVHGDGRFSYWTFVLGDPAGDDFDPSAPGQSHD